VPLVLENLTDEGFAPKVRSSSRPEFYGFLPVSVTSWIVFSFS
jgi:hypothetical protein